MQSKKGTQKNYPTQWSRIFPPKIDVQSVANCPRLCPMKSEKKECFNFYSLPFLKKESLILRRLNPRLVAFEVTLPDAILIFNLRIYFRKFYPFRLLLVSGQFPKQSTDLALIFLSDFFAISPQKKRPLS